MENQSQSRIIREAFTYFLCPVHGFFCVANKSETPDIEYENCPECLGLCRKNDEHFIYLYPNE